MTNILREKFTQAQTPFPKQAQYLDAMYDCIREAKTLYDAQTKKMKTEAHAMRSAYTTEQLDRLHQENSWLLRQAFLPEHQNGLYTIYKNYHDAGLSLVVAKERGDIWLNTVFQRNNIPEEIYDVLRKEMYTCIEEIYTQQ